ncbi:MAG: hypothetical protein II690_04220, partial [Ruminococcus sp.]|nr:hypothetical protein [Ruminococcus sp.]
MKKTIALSLALSALLTGCGMDETVPKTDSPIETVTASSDAKTEQTTTAALTTTAVSTGSTASSGTTASSSVTSADNAVPTAEAQPAVSNETVSAETAADSFPENPVPAKTEAAGISIAPIEDIPAESSIEQCRSAVENALSGVSVSASGNFISEYGSVNGIDYSLTLDLETWDEYTTPEQMGELSRLFWQVYPKMYQRFSDLSGAPLDVTLAIEDNGYEVADAGGDRVHIHDRWLYDNPGDYDCITHELAHIIQAGWDESYLEYSGYIERFADCCRFEYAMDGGAYNDYVWDLQTVDIENTRESSVRFLVWLDCFYSGQGNDILRKYFNTCRNSYYQSYQW